VTRARPIGAALAAVTLLLAGCAGNTVTGTGRALNPGAGTPTVPGGFPSTSAAPGASSNASTAPAGRGVLVTYPAGHFSVMMPTQATERSEPGSLGGASFTVYIAVSVSGGNTPTEVASEDIDQPLDPADYAITLRTAVGEFGSASGATVDSQTPTQYRGYTARRAAVTTPDGRPFTLLVFMYSSTRLFIVFASAGAVYDLVTSTLRFLP